MVFFSSVSNAKGEEQLSKKKKNTYLQIGLAQGFIYLLFIYLLVCLFIGKAFSTLKHE
jgi:hypothetical protein